MKTKLAIVTEIIAPYRIPVFNALARHEEIDLKVIFLSETDQTLRQWRVYTEEIRFAYQVLPSSRFRAGGLNLLLNTGLATSLNAFAPETIICGGYNYVASWQALGWARRHQVQFVLWSESNQQDARAKRKWVERLKTHFLRRCDGFVVPGKSSFEYLRLLGVEGTKIQTAPNAVDNFFFAAEAAKVKAQPGEFRERLDLPARYLLFVGRLVREKGVFDLLEAYAKLENRLRSEVGLVFAGDGSAKGDLERRAKQIGPGRVCFAGFAQREDLAGLYALSEALVLPTHSDPWGLVVNEAMACGLPVIVSEKAGCVASLVEDGWNGLVVPGGDVERLAVAIDSLLRQPERTRHMGARSLERVRQYTPESCADGLAMATTANKSVQWIL